MRMLALVAAAMAACLVAAPPAHASTYTVDSTADAVDATPGDDVCGTGSGACTLRAAVQEANAHAGADVVSLPPGTFLLSIPGMSEDASVTGDLDVTEGLEVRGAGMEASIVDALRLDRIFHVLGVPFTVRDLTLRNGSFTSGPGGAIFQAGNAALTVERVGFVINVASTGGAVAHVEGPLTIADATFDSNAANTAGAVAVAGTAAASITGSTFVGNTNGPAGMGGGVMLANTGTATVSGCTFSGHLSATGASLVSIGGALTVSDSTFEDNIAVDIGGGPVYAGPDGATLTNVTSRRNTAMQAAGGYVATPGAVQLSGGEFSDNFAFGQYAGFFIQSLADVAIQGTAFLRNGALADGGGLVLTGGTLALTDVEARENSANTASGLYLVGGGAVTLTRVRSIDNAATTGPGGGLTVQSPMDVTMADSTIDGNVGTQVAGLYVTSGGAVSVSGSTISNNRAVATGVVGGAYLVAASPSTVTNSTFSGNVADVQVGGFYAGGDFTLRNVTFANNDAPSASAIFNGGTVSLTSSIVAGPAASHCAGAPITSLGYNIDSTTTCNLAGPNDRSNTDPQLGPLQDNGGPTFTHLAATGSPALDTGDATGCPATDQRGQPRPTDADGDGTAVCDVGATEFLDLCPGDPAKTEPGACGCGVPDTDAADANGVPDCFVNGELKARLAHGKDMVNGLTGDASDDAMAAELVQMTDLVDDYMAAHPTLQLTGTKPKPAKLVKRLQKAVKRAVKAKGKKLGGAKKKALKAFDALDALIAPQA